MFDKPAGSIYIFSKVILASDNGSTSYDQRLGNAIAENPLFDADNGIDAHSEHQHVIQNVIRNKNKTGVVKHAHNEDDVDNMKYTSRYYWTHVHYNRLVEK